MKKLLLLIILFTLSHIGYGQCDKKVTFKCSKVREFKNGTFGQEHPLEATISINNGKIFITALMNGETETVEGEIKEVSICEWTEYLKNGKTQYKVYMQKGNVGENSLITIESEDGKIKITGSPDPEAGSKLQFDVAEYSIDEENVPPAKCGPTEKVKKTKSKTNRAS
jgi:hypothetical protein